MSKDRRTVSCIYCNLCNRHNQEPHGFVIGYSDEQALDAAKRDGYLELQLKTNDTTSTVHVCPKCLALIQRALQPAQPYR